MITGFRCAVCGAEVPVSTALPWKCPRATAADPFHVLHLADDGETVAPSDDPNPFVRYGPRLAWWAFAAKPRLVTSRPSWSAAATGHTPRGVSASMQWLIELP